MAEQNRFGAMFDQMKSGDDSTETKVSKPTKSKSTSKQKATKPKPKYKDPNYVQVGLYIPKGLHQKLKVGSALKDIEISDIAAEALGQWVKDNVPNI